MDTSDGLAPTLEELAIVNGMEIQIDIPALRGEPTGLKDTRLVVERLSFGWGDWTVVCIVRPENRRSFEAMAKDIGVTAQTVGRFVEGATGVLLSDGPRSIRAGRLESERFAADSWFTKGIGEYMSMLRAFPLP